MPPKPRAVAERFWAKVDRNGPVPPGFPGLGSCWIWTASRHRFGYGYFGIAKGKIVNAHRLCWQLMFGEIPEGLYVLHKCDNPPCLNPDHLFLGTQADNVKDAVAKGRFHTGDSHWAKRMPERTCRGDRHPSATITMEIARQIRALHAEGFSRAEIREKLNVKKGVIAGVVTNRSWREI